MKRARIPIVTMAALTMAAIGASAQTPQFVGSDACQKCHPDETSQFHRNPHSRTMAIKHETGSGCESCHGPGGDHVRKPSVRTIFSPSAHTAAEFSERCLSCHATDFNRAGIRHSEHTQAGVECTTCHSIHNAAQSTRLLARAEPALCYGCHRAVQAQFSMPFKHRVNEGFMKCTDCHNPHGAFAPTWRMAERPHMVGQQSLNEEACVGCHADKRGPFVFEHTAVRVDGCETCHMPHGSSNPRMLKRPVAFTMCLECHNGSGSGRTGLGMPFPANFHNLADPRYQNCTGCHVRIHGSNADPFFLR
ncbi:MAG TPA: DmsE family decaheme c-type cytochrome [Bryobacteraceae bacterium]|nr:DmsE family decaheme c-type cytochrome [Bryobacteraceae bacterium]